VDVTCKRGTDYPLLGYRDLHPNDFAAPNEWQTFAVPAEIRSNDTLVEIRGMDFIPGKTTVCCDWVALIPMSKICTDVIDAYAITASKIAVGAVTANKLLVAIIFLEPTDPFYLKSVPDRLCWIECSLFYQGHEYNIAANGTGVTADYPYIYWKIGDLFFTATNAAGKDLLTDANSYFMIAINKCAVPGSSHCLTWNATLIHGGQIITGSITAEEIDAGSIIITNSAQIAGAVQITPGQVIIDSAVTLNDWKTQGAGISTIKGGKIEALSITGTALFANTITASKLKPGVQQAMTSISMTASGYNGVSWSMGGVKTIDGTTYALTSGGSATGLLGTIYFYVSISGSTLTMNATSSYSSVLSDTTILLFVVIVSADTTQTGPTIIPMLGGRLYICADAIEANSIKGTHIQAGTITTGKIAFDLWPGPVDPAYVAGLLWYRSDLDQLRFSKGTTLNDVTVIPKVALSSSSAPGENQGIGNAGFEEDKGDHTPLQWSYWNPGGSGSIALSDYKRSGGHSCGVTALPSSQIGALSDPIAVDPNKTYYFETYSVTQVKEANTYVEVWLEGYATKTGASIGALAIGNNNRDVYPAWTKDTITTCPVTDIAWTMTGGHSRTEIMYVRIGLVCRNANVSGSRYVLFDNVVWSLQRAAASTEGIIATNASFIGGSTSVPSSTWTTLVEFTVPNVDHECFFVHAPVTVNEAPGSGFLCKGRIYDATALVYYPINNVAADNESCPVPNMISASAVFFFTIPKNIKNHVLRIQVWQNLGVAKNFYSYPTHWAHSQHYHQ
jgi:hypothetical protein